jgi:hypothetical protein
MALMALAMGAIRVFRTMAEVSTILAQYKKFAFYDEDGAIHYGCFVGSASPEEYREAEDIAMFLVESGGNC